MWVDLSANLPAVGNTYMKKQDTKKTDSVVSDELDSQDQCSCEGQCTDLQNQINAANAVTEEWKAKCMRALADYQNIERRSREEKNEVRLYASEIILGRLLPVVDTFGKVKSHIKDMGFDLAYKELLAVLEEQGVKKIDVIGREFNPHEMECIEVVAGDDNIVMEELLPGYRFFEKILRVAQVKVGKKS